jgi:long-chain fatty acid transport protein
MWHPKGAPWAYGFGVYAPFGLKTEWPANSVLRNFALKNELKYVTYNFTGAWQINPTLSLGGSITYNRVKADLSKGLGFIVPGSDMLRFNGDGDCFGFNVGFLWQPTAQHSFGLTYSHRTSVNLKGTTDIVPLFTGESSSARFEFPEVIIAGYSYRPTPEWNFEVNIDWTNWDRFNTVTIEKASGNIPIAFNWDSGFFYEFGATRYLGGGWNVSAGLCYTENSSPDATYTPIVPDADRLFYSLGAGYRTERFSADFAWHYGYSSNRQVTGSPPSLTGQTADGNYDNSINAFSLSLALHF